MGLTSCEKEALNGADGEATIHFTLTDSAYGSDEVRRAGHVRMEPETVVVPVQGDLHAYATLEEDKESPLRAPGDATLAVGTRVRIVVYNSSTNAYVNSLEYEVTNATTGAIKPASPTAGLTLTTGSYKFVAYSFNTTTVPDYAASITGGAPYSPNGNASDPLWGISGTTSITAGGTYNISIAMKHQFSRVAIKATTTGMDAPVPTISAMSAVLVGYKASAMAPLTGALTKGAAEEQTITFPSFSASTTVTSNACMVYTGGESTTSIKITSATIGGTTGSIPAPVSFNKQLEPGKSYTLRVSFKNLKWAMSNIYWVSTGSNVGYLTFDTTDKGHQGYQGVFFKFGSLVGISPAQTGSTPTNAFSNATPVYIPNYVPGSATTSTWSAPTTSPYTAAGWPAIVAGTAEDAAINIPYMDGRAAFAPPTNDNTSDITVIHSNQNTDAMYSAKRGDICQYLGKTQTALRGYRLPMQSEWGTSSSQWNATNPTTTPVSGGWVTTDGSYLHNNATGNGKPDGTADFRTASGNAANMVFKSAKNLLMGNIIIPPSGTRNYDNNNGDVAHVGLHAFYWCGSAKNNLVGSIFHYSSNGPYIPYGMNRNVALPIRCVKN
jgi:hypothetical protein